jgi:pimeloyl-ACP methyl ester carboxylesterase
MGDVSEPADEFSFLSDQAAEAGLDVPIPDGERLSLELADGRTLSALRYGGDAPVVTFLHGAGLNAHTWDTTILALGLPALALDLPGHGDSSWRDDMAYVARSLAPDAAAGMQAWTDRPQLLVGHSLGGLTAAAVAASRPDLVRELVIIDITPGIDPDGGAAQLREFFAGPADWASREELVERALAFGLGGSPATAARGVYFNSRVRPDGRVEWKHHFARLANTMASNPEAAEAMDAAQDAMRAILADTGWDDFAQTRAPITLLRGDRGYVTAAEAADFVARVPQASIVTVASGHNVQEELPVDLGRRLAAAAASE